MAKNLSAEAAVRMLQFGRIPRGPVISLRSSGLTAITGTTPVQIAAAPGVGKCIYVRRVLLINTTPAESPHVRVRPVGSTTPFAAAGAGDAFGNDGVYEQIFEPPLKMPANTAVEGVSHAAVGDVIATIEGVVGPDTGDAYLDPFELERAFLVGSILPDDAVPIYNANGTEIDGATPQVILPAAGPGKAYYISRIVMSNRTPTETPFIAVTTIGAGSTVTVLGPGNGNDNSGFIELAMHPLYVTAPNEGVQAASLSGSSGDTTVVIHGFHGSALS